jgi:hypothetical protein
MRQPMQSSKERIWHFLPSYLRKLLKDKTEILISFSISHLNSFKLQLSCKYILPRKNASLRLGSSLNPKKEEEAI